MQGSQGLVWEKLLLCRALPARSKELPEEMVSSHCLRHAASLGSLRDLLCHLQQKLCAAVLSKVTGAFSSLVVSGDGEVVSTFQLATSEAHSSSASMEFLLGTEGL